MEELLNVFQSDLGNISGEIQSLQEKSTFMNIKLKNRKVPTKIYKSIFNCFLDLGRKIRKGFTGYGNTSLYDKVTRLYKYVYIQILTLHFFFFFLLPTLER